MEPITEHELVDRLNDLRQLDYDAIQTYDQALAHLDAEDEAIAADLEQCRLDHANHLTALARLIERHGGKPNELSRDLEGALLAGLTRVRSVTGAIGALKAMRMNEQLTNHRYDRALELALPDDVRSVVTLNRDDERRHLAAIYAHLDRLAAIERERELELEADRADHVPHVRM